MDMLELIRNWAIDHPGSMNVVRYLLWVLAVVLVIIMLRRSLRRRISDTSMRYRSQKGVEFLGYLLVIILTISFFTGNIKDLALAIGLFTAGVTITLQELILSLAGSFHIFLVGVY